MTDETKRRKYCGGCRDNFYNGRTNMTGNMCWSLKDAQVVQRVFIHRDAPPPYKGIKPKATLDCWYGDTGMRAVKPETIGPDGFWK